MRLSKIVGQAKRIGVLCLVLSVLAVASCSPTNEESDFGSSDLLANRDNPNGGATGGAVRNLFGRDRPSSAFRRAGSDEFLNLPPPSRPLIEGSDQGGFTLNLVDVPIEEAARAVFGEVLDLSYAVSPEVTGRVTLQTSRPLTQMQLIDSLQVALELSGATLEQDRDVIRIVPLGGGAPRIVGQFDEAAVGQRIVAVPLQNIGTAEMSRLLQPVVGQSVGISSIPARNVLLISGNRAEISSTLEAVNVFDVDMLAGKSVALVPLRAAEPDAVVTELEQVFETGSGGSLENVVTFVPSTRLGAVLVISSRQKYVTEAETWIRTFDRSAGSKVRRPVVYNLQNRRATDLAPILADMLDDVVDSEQGAVAGTPNIVADEGKNAVIVWGNDQEQEAFARLVTALDTTPVQVLLEATIAEVTLTDQLEFGLRWFFESGDFSATFSDAPGGAVAPTFPGLSLLFQGSDARVALNALNSVTEVDVISSPSLLVIDNQEASLQIGDSVPIATQSSVSSTDPDAPIVNSIEYNQTGVLLTVRPRVSQSGQLTLDITQEVSDAVETITSGIDSPTISERTIDTSVSMRDGETIALGGLISESDQRTNGKVPVLGDVPGLGALFRTRSDSKQRTELLILITPRIMRNGSEARAITAELRERFSNTNGLVRDGVQRGGVVHRILD